MQVNLRFGIIQSVTYAYATFALIPFALGWLKWPIALVFLITFVLGSFFYARSLDFKKAEVWKLEELAGIAVVVLLWSLFSGAGGMGFQVADLDKVNTMVKDLSEKPWPVSYMVDGKELWFSHYLAYYLPGPTLVGFLGYKYVQLFLFLFTYLGYLLGFFWICRFVKNQKVLFTLGLIFFGGIGIISFLIKFQTGVIQETMRMINEHAYLFWINCWDLIPLNYNTITDFLYWTPNHGIAAFLGVGWLLNGLYVDKNIKYLPFLLSLLVFWSPLVLVGFLPLLLFAIYQSKGMREIFNATNFLIAPFLFFVVASFILAIDSKNLVQHFIFKTFEQDTSGLLEKVAIYFYFLCMEVFVWAIPVYFFFVRQQDKALRRLFFLVVLLLSVIPLYRFGLWNDWCTRVSYPSLLLLGIFSIKALLQSAGWRKILLLFLLISGSFSPIITISSSVKEMSYVPKFKPTPAHLVADLPGVCIWYPLDQFVAEKESFFFTYLAKEK